MKISNEYHSQNIACTLFSKHNLFKIFNRINQNFGVTIVAVDLKLLRKNKIRFPIKNFFFKTKENTLIFFGPMDTAQKLKKIKNSNFRNFTDIYIYIYRLNVYINRIFVKNFVQPVGRPNYLVPNLAIKTIKA